MLQSGLQAQNDPEMDSIWASAISQKDTFEKSRELLIYANRLRNHSLDSAINFLDSLANYYKKQNLLTELGRIKSLKAWFLLSKSHYEESIELGYEALAILKEQNDSSGIARTLNRIGIASSAFKKNKAARKLMEEALIYFTNLKDTVHISSMLNNLGLINSQLKDNKAAIGYFKRCLDIRQKMKDPLALGNSYYNLGYAYLNWRQYDSARVNMLKAIEILETKTDDGKIPSVVSEGLGELYHLTGNDNEALKWLLKAVKDGRETNHFQDVATAQKTLADTYYKLGNYKKAYEANRAYRKLQDHQDSINSQARVAEVIEKYKTAQRKAEIADLKTEAFEAKSKAQKSTVAALIAILLAVAAIAVLIIVFQRRFQKQKLQQSELNRQISDVKMMALRAQMNPHFIFNCINTSQNFILNSDKKAAYEYLAMFAGLLRLVLENSGKTLVPLEDELKQLKLYIELEAERFDHKFNYQLEIDPELENGVYEIPGMVVQPIIENAILHGLINRNDDGGELYIKVTKKQESIQWDITDNGVGRKKAAAIKAKKDVHYQSAAIPNIEERLDILQRSQEDRQIYMKIFDLYEGDEASGTRVRLILPFK